MDSDCDGLSDFDQDGGGFGCAATPASAVSGVGFLGMLALLLRRRGR